LAVEIRRPLKSAAFVKDGEDPPGPPPGSCRSTAASDRSARARITTQPGTVGLTRSGLTVGRSLHAISDDHPGGRPWRFTGGTIHLAAVDVSGEPCVNLEREAAAMLARE